MGNRKESIAIHLGSEQLAALNELSKESRVPRAAIIRLAIDGYLERIAAQRAVSRVPRCGRYLGDNDGTCPQLSCVRERGHAGLCDNTSDRADE